jgi:hypothetical protein
MAIIMVVVVILFLASLWVLLWLPKREMVRLNERKLMAWIMKDLPPMPEPSVDEDEARERKHGRPGNAAQID